VKEAMSIRNFLIIKKADIEVKKINVIIGPQAQGKSLIAKLLFFFKSISNSFSSGSLAQISKRELDKKILSDFEERFPRYTWQGSSFSISYEIEDISIVVQGKNGGRGKTNLSLHYSDNLKKIFDKSKRTHKKAQEPTAGYQALPVMGKTVENNPAFFATSAFIPASRSFFANLQKNIFTFLSSNLDIDPFLKEFGSLYESSKRSYKDPNFGKDNQDLLEKLHLACETVIDGSYEYYDNQDWISSGANKVNLSNASSGQQESLPMLLTLCHLPIILQMPGSLFFIEEPEAHLFPTSQSSVVSIFSLLYGTLGTNFFITTHSPYILSALNNLIMAADTIAEGKLTEDKFIAMNGPGLPIKFEDIAAYTINNGVTKSIVDQEYRMIGGEILDEISEHFETVMNKLLVSGE